MPVRVVWRCIESKSIRLVREIRANGRDVHASQPIPKGLNHSARGCEDRATPGTRTKNTINPNGVGSFSPAFAVRAAQARIAYWVTGRRNRVASTGADDATPLGLGIIWADDPG